MIRFVWRIIRKYLLIGLALIWVWNAGYHFLLDTAHSGDQVLARLYLAVIHGLADIPRSFDIVITALGSILGLAHGSLTDQLGYDPFEVPVPDYSAPRDTPPPQPYLGAPQPGLPSASGLVRRVAGNSTFLILAQFLLLLWMILKDDVKAKTVTWRSPGIVAFLRPRDGLFYNLLLGSLAALLVILAFLHGVISGIFTLIAALLILRGPIGGLPLWVLDVSDMRPTLSQARLAAFGGGLFEELLRRFAASAEDRAAATQRLSEQILRLGWSELGTRRKAFPETDDPEALYDWACRTLELDPRTIERATARSQWLKGMRANHSAPGENTERAQTLNRAYEIVLAYHGWRR